MSQMITLVYIGCLTILLQTGCGGSSDSPASSTVFTTWSGEIDNSASSVDILDIVAEPISLVGVRLFLSSITDGAHDTAVATNEKQFQLKIVDINQVTIGTPISVGANSNEFIVFDNDTVHMLASSGTLTFNKIGRNSNDTIDCTVDLGFISTSNTDVHSATMKGTVSAKIP
jgi:hypothetical protein